MILKTFLIALAEILHLVIYGYTIVIFIACILSFVNPNPHNKFVQVIYKLSEPAFRLVRRNMPTSFSGLDLAPLVVFLVLAFLDKFLVGLLYGYIASM